MKRKRPTTTPLAACAALLVFAILLVGAVRTAYASAPSAYSVATVYRGLQHDPAAWQGRVVRIRGTIQIVGGVAPAMPQMTILNDPSDHLMVGAFDLLRVGAVRWLLGRDNEGGTPGLFLHRAPASRQRLVADRSAIYRVRLTREPFAGQFYAVATAL